MKLTGHKTEAVYRRYEIVSEADLAAGVTRLAVLHESLTKATRTVVPMRPVRSGGDHSERGGCGPPPVAAPRSGPQATRAPPQHLRAGVPRSRPRGRASASRQAGGRPRRHREQAARPRGRDRGTPARRCCGGALVAWGPDRGAATGGGPHPPRSEWSPPDLTGRIGTTVRVAFVRLSWSTAKRVTPAARSASETIA